MQEKEEFSLTPEEVARILKITRNTVYELVKRGELSAFRVGRKLRIDRRDVDTYKEQGKGIAGKIAAYPGNPTISSYDQPREGLVTGEIIIISGQDIVLDILGRHLERHPLGFRVWRNQVGSFAGLYALYHDKAHMASVHLWDGDTGTYNVPYVRSLLPGIPAIIISLAVRMQGFYVLQGNPKKINNWSDLSRSDIRLINREKGCGTRVLLDEQVRLLGIDRHAINGYENEEHSHLAVASKVARGEADVALGNQKGSMQVRGIDFIPLQAEKYELVIKKEDFQKPWFKATLEVISSESFKGELQGLGDYNLDETGQMKEV